MESQHNLLMVLAYRGTAYCGSQIQKNGITIQELLNTALEKIFCQTGLKTIFSGRTDSGVHSCCQPVNVLVARQIPCPKVKAALNSLLPPDIRLVRATYVEPSINARFSAKSREYLYTIYLGEILPPYLKDLAWQINPKEFNFSRLKKAAALIRGEHDFSGFCAAGSTVGHKVRKVTVSTVRKQKAPSWLGASDKNGYLITYRIKANGFLYHMVRNIVSALVDVAKGTMTLAQLRQSMAGKSRQDLKSVTAPPQGLVLYKVEY